MAIPINKVAGPDNPSQASLFVVQGHDVPIDGSKVRFGLDWLGMAAHGDGHTHVDALCHISYDGVTYNGRAAAEVLPSNGATAQDIAVYHQGIVGRGVLLDIPSTAGSNGLSQARPSPAGELEQCAVAQGVEIGQGDILVFRTGHARRRLELGPWTTAHRLTVRARRDCTWMRSSGCTNAGSLRFCLTVTERLCRVSSKESAIRSTRFRWWRWACWSQTACSLRIWFRS